MYQHQKNQDHAQSTNVLKVGKRIVESLGQQVTQAMKHIGKNAIEHANQPTEHPQGDGQRQPNQQPCKNVFFQVHGQLNDKRKKAHNLQRWPWPLVHLLRKPGRLMRHLRQVLLLGPMCCHP
jgi:hypothetical protein